MTLAERVSRSALVVRALVGLTGAASLLLAVPAPAYGTSGALRAAIVGVALAVALAPAVTPGRWPVMAVELLVVGLWLIPVGRGDLTGWLVALALAVLLFTHHMLASVAVLGLDARLRRDLCIGFVRRWAVVAGGGVVVAAVVALVSWPAGAATVPDWALPIGLPIGLLVALLVTALPLWFAGRGAPARSARAERAALAGHGGRRSPDRTTR